jgi:hypothetical protein
MTRKKKAPIQEVPVPFKLQDDPAPPRPVPERVIEVPEEPMEACCNLGLAPNVAQKRDRSPSPQLDNKKPKAPDSDTEDDDSEEEAEREEEPQPYV